MNQDIKQIFYSHDEIVNKSIELAKCINRDYDGKFPIFIGLLKGCVPFLAELIKHITVPMEYDFMDVSSYEGTSSTGNIKIIKDLDIDICNRDIIIVEDIIDTGLTLHHIVNLLKSRKVSSIEIVTLLDKVEGRIIDTVKPKYIGFNVKKEFVVGFGLDYNQKYRNLPYIGILKEEIYK